MRRPFENPCVARGLVFQVMGVSLNLVALIRSGMFSRIPIWLQEGVQRDSLNVGIHVSQQGSFHGVSHYREKESICHSIVFSYCL